MKYTEISLNSNGQMSAIPKHVIVLTNDPRWHQGTWVTGTSSPKIGFFYRGYFQEGKGWHHLYESDQAWLPANLMVTDPVPAYPQYTAFAINPTNPDQKQNMPWQEFVNWARDRSVDDMELRLKHTTLTLNGDHVPDDTSKMQLAELTAVLDKIHLNSIVTVGPHHFKLGDHQYLLNQHACCSKLTRKDQLAILKQAAENKQLDFQVIGSCTVAEWLLHPDQPFVTRIDMCYDFERNRWRRLSGAGVLEFTLTHVKQLPTAVADRTRAFDDLVALRD